MNQFWDGFEKQSISLKMVSRAMSDRMGKSLDSGSKLTDAFNQTAPMKWLRSRHINKNLNKGLDTAKAHGADIRPVPKEIRNFKRSSAKTLGVMFPKGTKRTIQEAQDAGGKYERRMAMESSSKKGREIAREIRKGKS